MNTILQFIRRSTEGAIAVMAALALCSGVLLANDAPVISSIPDQWLPNTNPATAGTVSFFVDDDGGANALVPTRATTNGALLPLSGISVSATGVNRTVTLTPNPGQQGVATVTLTFMDGGGKSSSVSFTVTVNNVPTFTKMPNANISVGASAGPQVQSGWAVSPSQGTGESEDFSFVTVVSNPSIFSYLPVVLCDGTLQFTPSPSLIGTVGSTVTVTLVDAFGGVSLPQVYQITVIGTSTNQTTFPKHTVDITTIKATAYESGAPGEFALQRSGASGPLRVLLSLGSESGAATLGDDYTFLAPGASTYILGGEVAAIRVTNRGSGYASPPTVSITQPLADPETGLKDSATAQAIIDGSGFLVGIQIMHPGSGYTSAPTITIGGTGGATAVAQLSSTSSLSVTIPDGVMRQRIIVVPQQDFIKELSETVTLQISASPTYNRGLSSQSAVIIADDDMVAHVSSPDPLASEFFADPSPTGRFRVDFNDWSYPKNFATELAGSATPGQPNDYVASFMPIHYPSGGQLASLTTISSAHVAGNFTTDTGDSFAFDLRGSGWYCNTPPTVGFTSPTVRVESVDTVLISSSGAGYDPEDPPVFMWPTGIYGRPAYGYGVVDSETGQLQGMMVVDGGVYAETSSTRELTGTAADIVQFAGAMPSAEATFSYTTTTRVGSTAMAEAVINGIVTSITMPTHDWTSSTTIVIAGGGGTGATAVMKFSSVTGDADGIMITNPGSGYTSRPTVTLTDSTYVATVLANISGPALVNITNAGLGYTDVPTMTLTGTGSSATYLNTTPGQPAYNTLTFDPGSLVLTDRNAQSSDFVIVPSALDYTPNVVKRRSDAVPGTGILSDWVAKAKETTRAVNKKGTNLLEVLPGYGPITVGDVIEVSSGGGTWYVVTQVELQQDSTKGTTNEDLTCVLHLGAALVADVTDDVVVTNRLARGSSSTMVRQDVIFSLGRDDGDVAAYPAFDVLVSPVNDVKVEGAEDVSLTMYSSREFALMEPTVTTMTIADDDSIVSIVMTGNASEPILSGSMRVNLTAALPVDITIPFIVSGTATPGNGLDATPTEQDYIITGLTELQAPTTLSGNTQPNAYAVGSVSIPAGATIADIIIGTLQDQRTEGTEQVTITLQASHDVLLAGSQSSQLNSSATVNISDSQGTARIDPAYTRNGQEDPNRPEAGVFRVMVTKATGLFKASPVGVRFKIDGSATYSVDYLISGNGVAFDPVKMEGSVVINADTQPSSFSDIQFSVKDDLLGERDETISMTLLSGSGYSIDPDSSGGSILIIDDEPVISISADVQPAEPNVTGRFALHYTCAGQDRALNRAVTVPFTLLQTDFIDSLGVSHYMAKEDVDFNALQPRSVTFVAGSNSTFISVVPKPDNVTEPVEEVNLTLVSDPGYSLDSANAVLRLQDAPLVSLASVQSAAENGQTGVFKVSYAGDARQGAVLVNLAVDAATTTSVPEPLADLTGVVTVNSLSQEKQIGASTTLEEAGRIVVSITLPKVDLSGTSITLNLRQGGLTGTVLGTVTVPQKDYTTADFAARSGLSVQTLSSLAAGQVVVLSAVATGSYATVSSQIPVSAALLTSSTDATFPLSLEIPAGKTSALLTVTAIDDQVLDPGEKLSLRLLPSTQYLLSDANSPVSIDILDDEPSMSVSATTATTKEGSSSYGVFSIGVSSAHSGITIPLILAGTATPLVDYTLTLEQGGSSQVITPDASGAFDIALGASVLVAQVSVHAMVDVAAEDPESVTLTLRLGSGAPSTAAGQAATVAITDDKPVVSIKSDGNVPENGGSSSFTVSRDDIGNDLTISFAVSGTAKAGEDYVSLLNSVTIPAGTKTATLPIVAIDDVLDPKAEGFESIEVTLSTSPTGLYSLASGASQASMLIVDDEFTGGLPVVTVVTDVLTIPENGGQSSPFFLDRTYNIGELQVAYVLEGMATRDVDYTVSGTPGLVKFTSGTTRQSVVISPIDDGVAEGGETVVLRVLPGVTYDIGQQSAASLLIADDDTKVSLEMRDPLAHESNLEPGMFRIVAQPATINRHIVLRLNGTAFWGSADDHTVASSSSADYFLSLQYEGQSFFSSIIFTPSPFPLGSRLVVDLPQGVNYVDVKINISVDDRGRDDNRAEGRETVIPVLETSSDYVLGQPTSGVISIADNDAQLTIVRDHDGGEPSTAGAFKVVASTAFPVGIDVDVPYEVVDANSTAIAVDDYARLSGTLRLIGGNDTGEILVRPISDTLVESTETVQVRLKESLDYVISGQPTATVNLADQIATVTVAAGAIDPSEGSPVDNGTFTITATRALTATGATADQSGFAVYYNLAGTAVNGTDFEKVYSGTQGSVTIPQNGTTGTVVIIPNDDTLAEGTESVILTLLDGPGYVLGATTSATLSLLDDEPTIAINAGQNGQEAGADATFTVSYSGSALNHSISVGYAMDSTSVASTSDIGTLSGVVVIPSGQSSTGISVSVVDDTILEGNERLTLKLLTSDSYMIDSTAKSASVTILDNEPTVSVTASTATTSEPGTAPAGVFTFSLSAVQSADLTVSYVVSGTATSGTDYTSIGSSVVFTAGQITRTVNVAVLDDVIQESTETVIVTLSASTAYALGSPAVATVTITDNDASTTPTPSGPPTGSVADAGGSSKSGGCGLGGGMGLLLGGLALVLVRRRR